MRDAFDGIRLAVRIVVSLDQIDHLAPVRG